MLWLIGGVIAGLLVLLIISVVVAAYRLATATRQIALVAQKQVQTSKSTTDHIELLEKIHNDLQRVTGYVRYLRARAWRDDPSFIEDVNEGESKLAPQWHELQNEYGLWVRESDEHEGAMRIMRGETTKSARYLRAAIGDAAYERIAKVPEEQARGREKEK